MSLPIDLTNREGKTLRYYAGRTRNGDRQISADACIVTTEWSDLPHSHMQAVMTLTKLLKYKLVRRDGSGWVATTGGINLEATASKKGMWQTPPPPSITNTARSI